jgi:hypothetical protein
MSRAASRRHFLQAAALGGAALSAADFSFLGQLPHVSAQEAKKKVPLDASIEPLVQLIEDTPQNQLLEKVAERIRNGASYREVLAGLLLAAVRNVQPRPSVGFKFHAVLVVNSCHLASVSGPDQDRWLPIFWALDYFKNAQADEASKSNWKMAPVNEARVPDAVHARDLFVEAMNHWDAEKADVATAGLVRNAPATEVFQLFAQYAARDFRAIGHKAIFLANAWRTLQVIGWEYAEPVLRSLSNALMNHEGGGNPAATDLAADRPWRDNVKLLELIPASWLNGSVQKEATRDLCTTLHTASADESAAAAAKLLEHGVDAASVWDAVFVGAGETLMRQPAIVGLHGLTTANAMHFLWQNVGSDELRKRLLLQGVSFTALFREAAKGRGELKDLTIDSVTSGGDSATLDDVFAAVSRDRLQAANKLNAYLSSGGSAEAAIDQARRLIFLKGRDSHDYKFSSAVLEDYYHVTPAWRNLFLALSVFNLKGSGDRDNGLVARTRSALA